MRRRVFIQGMPGGGLFIARQECRDDVAWITVGHCVALSAFGVADETTDECRCDCSPVSFVALQVLIGEIPK